MFTQDSKQFVGTIPLYISFLLRGSMGKYEHQLYTLIDQME